MLIIALHIALLSQHILSAHRYCFVQVETDEGGTPVPTTWSMDAFGHSDEARARLMERVKDDPDHYLHQLPAETCAAFITAPDDTQEDAGIERGPEVHEGGLEESKQEEKKETEYVRKAGWKSTTSVAIGPVVTLNE